MNFGCEIYEFLVPIRQNLAYFSKKLHTFVFIFKKNTEPSSEGFPAPKTSL